MKPIIKRLVLFVIVIFFIGSQSCNLTQKPSTQSPAEMMTSGTPGITTGTINGPGGMVLNLEGKALSDNAKVKLEVIEVSELTWEDSPFQAASKEYSVSFGDGEQVGNITLTVPLNSPTANGSLTASLVAMPASSFAYAVWSYPDSGIPSIVGAIVDQNHATFPVVGPGKYQVLQIPSSSELIKKVDVTEPLSAPSYPQFTPSWCSTTTMTDLAGYHEGAWPPGDLGSTWGESSNWYLAGKAGQASNSGYFFNWILQGVGFPVPEDVRQSFTYGYAKVFIWNWQSRWISPFMEYLFGDWYVTKSEEYAKSLFSFFQAYVEMNVWGLNGSRRPVAWGSLLAGHSRLITGRWH